MNTWYSRQSRGMFIGGRFVPVEGTMEVVSPANVQHVVGLFADAVYAVDEAVERAQRAYRDWRRVPVYQRLGVLNRFADVLTARRTELARAIATEVGKPWHEAEQEAALLPTKLRQTAALAQRELSPVVPDGVDGYWDLRPLGVVAVLGPFNFPVHLSNGHIAPALAAGNAVILKPSEAAPACAELYTECWSEAAGPHAAVFSLLPGGPQCGERLAVHDGVAAVCFTGSWSVGVRLRELTARQTGKLLALEMGGKNPALVLADADLQLAAAQVLDAALWSCGQRCTATSRVLVESAVYDELAERIVAGARQWEPASPLDPGCRLGPLSTRRGWERFVQAQREVPAGMSTLLAGGEDAGPGPKGYWVRPAIHEVTHSEQCVSRWQNELFGPELLLERVDGDEALVERANATPYGLACSVFTRSRERFDRMRLDVDAGIVNWNRGTAGASGAMPFGGLKNSGNHRPAGSWSLRYCVAPVSTLLR
jgi:succinylglutamic semialdehyde dehydrogenase